MSEIYAKSIVTQKFSNPTDNPLELKIYILKNNKILFSSFHCKIGENVEVKSKVIKKEKAVTKYTDSIAKGNAAIFVSQDPENENRLIINMGNIPPKTEVIFTSEFLNYVEMSHNYEFELFRNLPIFTGGKDKLYQNSKLKGTINIMTKNDIIKIEKNILLKNLKIIEEKYQSDKKNNYIISYIIDELPQFSWSKNEYIPSSKIYFNTETKGPFALCQESLKEQHYIVHFRYKKEKKEEEEIMNPALFIFLLDQSGSMDGDRIKIAAKALELFIQSLPAGSYYQIIGFGSDFEPYDKEPLEYNIDNIKKSLELIKKLRASLGGTNIAGPLKYIYDSEKIYEKIQLPRNIILLTDGAAWDKEKGLNLIEQNSLKYFVHSIGIGGDFDEDLIKNAAILGKGSYDFCKDLNNLNNVIASLVNRSTKSYITNIQIKSNLEDENKIKNIIPNTLRNNSIINLSYILDDNIDKININIKYEDKEENKKIENNYEIIPEKLEKGEYLPKIIIFDYLTNNKSISIEEKINLALKYQIFMENTSLFAEVKLSEKITEKMKSIIIGDKENNVIPKFRQRHEYKKKSCGFTCCKRCCCFGLRRLAVPMKSSNPYNDDSEEGASNDDSDGCDDSSDDGDDNFESKKAKSCAKSEPIKEKEVIKKKEEKKDMNEKENIMKMIGTQNFIEGFWEENEYTKKIRDKYKKEYDLIKGMQNKNMNEKIALTILILYVLNKDYSHLLSELVMIIKKARQFILKETKDNYDNIIKEIGI